MNELDDMELQPRLSSEVLQAFSRYYRLEGRGEVFWLERAGSEANNEVGNVNHPDIDIERITRQLEDAKAALIDQSYQSKESRATVVLDQQSVGRLSRMDAMQGQAMAKAEEDRRQLAIRRIDAALARVGRGGFGECIECGEWISAKRLEWDPTVLKCIDCAE
ncbi:TraR/DksA family transcriptional regulator [Halomonas sp. RA08-2]|uniref:TraR/DksA family transcriptional regulator n=1 Tax=Halomonas sp. RA08-2 TaxID=3440842 RepID=UPI003EEDB49D